MPEKNRRSHLLMLSIGFLFAILATFVLSALLMLQG